MGLHDSEASADRLVEEVVTVAPWFADAAERWSGVLAPFRTKGESNLIDPTAPARLFDPLAAAPGRGEPVVVFTTIGWNRDGVDMARVQDIGTGTAAVRISMTAVPGLRSQQTFFFPGIIAIDPPTLSFWDNEASLVAWAHNSRRTSARWIATGRPATPTGPRSRALLPSAAAGRGTAGPGRYRPGARPDGSGS